MSGDKTPEFGRWRSFFWPVHNYELKKIVPMLLLFFLINCNYTLLRDTKDTLIVTSSAAGAETIPFLKMWGVMPCAILFSILYAKMANMLSKKKLFYAVISCFLGYFALFALVLYPCREFFQLNALADWLLSVLPGGFRGLVSVIRDPVCSSFYCMAETFGSFGISVLFWGFANDITRVSESKRYYALFGLGANAAMLCTGPAIVFLARIAERLYGQGTDAAWSFNLKSILAVVVMACAGAMLIYRWINNNVLTDERFYSKEEQSSVKKAKPKMPLMESLKFLATSKEVRHLAMLVLGYGICINLVETPWKGQLKLQYPNPNDYQEFMGKFSFCTGFVTVIMLLFVGGNVMRRFGWLASALTTPVILLLTGIGFFGSIVFADSLAPIVAYFGTTPLFLSVIFGTMQNIASKSTKYSSFDLAKETLFSVLPQEVKVKGKAIIDVPVSRGGKSLSALWIQIGLLIFGSLPALIPCNALLLLIVITAWIYSSIVLSHSFAKATRARGDNLTG